MRLLKTKKIFTATIEVKRSKFIAFLMPDRDFKKQLEHLRAKHPKARHFVYAWRILNEHLQIVEQSSDDGEPRGTSGRPSLHVLQGSNLINIAVIIVRYFGGIKLGTGGLVRAYSDAVHAVIESVELVDYVAKEVLSFKVRYSQFEKFKYLLNSYEESINNQEFLSDYIYVSIEISVNKKDDFINKANSLFYT